MDIEQNPAFTGFFNEGQKRIDIVIVINEVDASEKLQDIRMTFLMNILKLGLELEVEIGKLAEHKNLLFVKVHAPDSIIEEFGLLFNERRFFKDNHIDFVHPYFNFMGMNHERDLIKTIRNQYPGPGSCSTLERSMIVYKILLQLPFGQHENHYGIDKLINANIVLDAFALHDGPYFIPPKQETSEYINARQVLFYNWVGFINIWKMQPIHMIKEYFGERVAFYFSYYEFFNIMLTIITLVGAWIAFDQYFAIDKPDPFTKVACDDLKNQTDFYAKTCNECRNITLCPSLHYYDYCPEVQFIARIDTESMYNYAFFVSLWGLIFVILWKRHETYLMWIWEMNEKCINKLRRPEVLHYSRIFYIKFNLTALSMGYQSILVIIIRGFIILLTMAISCALVHAVSFNLNSIKLWAILIISLKFCYFKHWYRHMERYPNLIGWKEGENKRIAMAASMHTTFMILLKIVVMIISYISTELEKYDTYALYDRSLAIKMFGFNFLSTYSLVFCYTCLGVLIFTHHLDKDNYHSLEGFGVMNNGYGTSFDDVCVTVVVMVILEQVIFKIPTILYYKMSDYDQLCVFDANIPCWEREYKLPNLNEIFIHNSYSALAMKFAMATLFSYTCPIVTLFIFLMSIWDIRYKARRVLLWHRRPLLINASGPGIWHRMIFIAAHVIPLLNASLITLQSRYFLKQHALNFYLKFTDNRDLTGEIAAETYIKRTELYDQLKALQYKYSKEVLAFRTCSTLDFWGIREFDYYNPTLFPWWIVRCYRVEFLILCEVFLLLITILLHFLIPSMSDDIKETIKKEKQIKQEFYIRKGFLGT